jgi:ice-binding like protein
MADQLNRRPNACLGAGRVFALVSLALALTLTLAGNALAGPSPVLLGTSGEFSVLAGSGMTNTGASTLVGDVGASPTHTQTGFAPCPAADCVTLTGANHNVADPNDAVTQQAKTDLAIAYDDAFGRTGGTAISAPLGGGQTLVSGVYTSAADIFVGGDLTLDAGGDPAAVFIFQAKTGTLNTAAGISSGVPNTRVLLSNGAQACNVYWQVGSSATIATFTQFVGNVLALQSITVNTSATLDTGRVLARNGAVTLDTNTIKKATCATPRPGDAAPSTTSTGTAATTPTAPTPSTPSPPRAGTAVISGPSGPVSGPFTVSVTGQAIEKVTFYVDGKPVATVKAKPGRKKFTIIINPRRHSHRVHEVKARIKFTKKSGFRTATRRLVYRRASSQSHAVRFTG